MKNTRWFVFGTVFALLVLGGMSLPAVVDAAVDGVTVPRNFQAAVGDSKALVVLNWDPATAPDGIKAYRIDRSLDSLQWTTQSSDITDVTYRDTHTAYGVHYFYRLAAISTGGVMSGWIFADVSTPDYAGGGQMVGSDQTLTSDDKKAKVLIPAGAVGSGTSCSIGVISVGASGLTLAAGNKKVVGPYNLSCRSSVGSVVTDYQKPVVWTLIIKDDLDKLVKPAVYTYKSGAKPVALSGSVYDVKNGWVKAEADAKTAVVVIARQPGTIPVNAIVIVLTLVGIVGGVMLLIAKIKKKQTYDNYLRNKYYDL